MIQTRVTELVFASWYFQQSTRKGKKEGRKWSFMFYVCGEPCFWQVYVQSEWEIDGFISFAWVDFSTITGVSVQVQVFYTIIGVSRSSVLSHNWVVCPSSSVTIRKFFGTPSRNADDRWSEPSRSTVETGDTSPWGISRSDLDKRSMDYRYIFYTVN